MKIVTVINDETNPFFNLLRLSCAVHGLELIVLVSNQINFSTRRIKDDLLKDYLEAEEDDEIILFTDGTDVVFTAGEEEILYKFAAFKKEIVFSGETGCWPDKSLASQYPPSGGSPYRYLNSGGFIGKAAPIKQMLEDNAFDLENFAESNQYIWTKRYFKYPEKIELDERGEIFCTFSPEIREEYLPAGNDRDFRAYYRHKKDWFNQNFQVKGGRIFNVMTNTWPCQAHFNGTSKHLIDDDIVDMVYSNIPQYRKPKIYYEE